MEAQKGKGVLLPKKPIFIDNRAFIFDNNTGCCVQGGHLVTDPRIMCRCCVIVVLLDVGLLDVLDTNLYNNTHQTRII